MTAITLAAVLLGGAPLADSAYLYKALLIRAAPGALVEVISAYREHASSFEAVGDHAPFMMRHSQGDQWDLMLIFPMGSFTDYYAPERVARRGAAGAFERDLRSHIAWREEVFVTGPSLETVATHLRAGSFYHVEMFLALPGKYPELRHEREMENAYLAMLNRPQNLIFDRVAGAAWDLFTVGVYRDIQHFAESGDIPPAKEEAAARAAGFEAADRIGIYLRTLIQSHHDTLARAVQ